MEQSDLNPYCLQYRLAKNLSRREEQLTKVVTGELRVNGVCSRYSRIISGHALCSVCSAVRLLLLSLKLLDQ